LVGTYVFAPARRAWPDSLKRAPGGRKRLARKRHTAEQIIAKLREVELALSKDQPLVDVVRKLEISEQTY